MKRILSLIAVAGTFVPCVFAADQYTVFKVCEDKHVIKTSDGAEAGHIEYIVTDPGQQRIVSAVVTGGVVADRLIPIPFEDITYGTGNDVVINIDRQRIISAPVIEHTQFTSGAFIEPSIVERSTTYFRGSNERGEGFNGRPGERNTNTNVNVGTERENRGGAGLDRSNTSRENNARENNARENNPREQANPNARGNMEPGARTNPGGVSTDPSKLNHGNATNPGKEGALPPGSESKSSTAKPESKTTPGAESRTNEPRTNEPRTSTTDKSLNKAEEKANHTPQAEEKARETEKATRNSGSSAAEAAQERSEASKGSRTTPQASSEEKEKEKSSAGAHSGNAKSAEGGAKASTSEKTETKNQ